MTTYELARQAFEEFVEQRLPPALSGALDLQCPLQLFVQLHPSVSFSRRILVESEPGEALVKVRVEASYQLFEGDTHYHVRCIGATPRQQAAQQLKALLAVAFEAIIGWHSTHHSLWEDEDD